MIDLNRNVTSSLISILSDAFALQCISRHSVTKVKWNSVEIKLSYEISLLIASIKNMNLLIRIARLK